MAQYDDLIESSGKQYNVDPALIRAVIQVESGWNPNAVSQKGAVGLGQLVPATAKSLGVKDPTDPKQAIPAVAQLLNENLNRYGNVQDALRAYHGGTDQKNWGPLTQAYPGKVLNSLNPSSQPQTLPGIPTQSQAPAGNALDMFQVGAGGSAPAGNALDKFNIGQQPTPPKQSVAQPVQQPAQAANPQKPFEWYDSPALNPTRLLIGGLDWAANKLAPNSALSKATGSIENASNNLSKGAYQGLTQDVIGGPIQLGTNVVDWLTNKVAPNSQAAQMTSQGAGALNEFMKQREAQYQAETPGSIAAGVGRTAANVAAALKFGGQKAIEAGGAAGSKLAQLLGGGPGAQNVARITGNIGGSAALGGAAGALSPVNEGDYWSQKGSQIGTGAAVGAAAPVAGSLVGSAAQYTGNALRSLIDPFTQAGQQRIAGNVLSRAAQGGPTAVNAGQIVPGSVPTLAEATGNPGIATLQRTIRDVNPAPFVEREQGNAAARLNALTGAAGTSADIAAQEAARSQAAQQQLAQVFQNKTVADSKPVLDAIDSILGGPSGKRPAVNSSLTSVRNLIQDKQGNVISDPETLYNSVRKGINDMIDSKMTTANPSGIQASRELLQVRDALDQQIGKAAPGFDRYLSNYSQASKPINAMQYLQGLNLTDANGNITLNKVQNAIKSLSKQTNAPGASAAKDVSSTQLDTLKSIRDDLLRSNNLNLGRSAGSNTAQNLATQNMLNQVIPGRIGAMAGNIGPANIGAGVGGALGGMLGGIPGAGIGAAGGRAAGSAFGGLMNTSNAAIQNRLAEMLLNPNAGAAVLNSNPILLGPRSPTAITNTLNRYIYPGATIGAVGLSR